MAENYLFNPKQRPSFEEKWDEIYKLCLQKAIRWHNHPRYQEPEDLAQIAAIKVWRAFGEYDESLPLAAFVNKIAFNAFVDTCRSNRGAYEVSLDETRTASTHHGGVVCTSVDREEDSDTESRPAYSVANEGSPVVLVIDSFLNCLSSRQRRVIEMSFGIGKCWWERTDDSIAEELGVTRQTVISDRKKAILDMQARVGRIRVKVA